MKYLVILLSVLFLRNAQAAHAAPSGNSGSPELSELSLGIERSLYLDLYLYTGYSQFSHANFSDAVAGVQSGIGFSIGTKLGGGFFGGFATDFRYMAQTSSVDATHTNFSSTRFMSFAPMIGYHSNSIIVKIEYQFAGDLQLTKDLFDGSSEKFSKPNGFRLIFIFDQWFKSLPVGLYGESVNYSQMTNSANGITDLSNSFNTWQFGGIINVLL